VSDSYLCYNNADKTKPTLREGQSKEKKKTRVRGTCLLLTAKLG